MHDLTSERSSVLLQNTRSASKNLDEFRVVLKEERTLEKIVAIVLTETWLKDNSPANVYKLDGFNSPIMCNRDRRGGGVSVSVKDGLTFKTFLQILTLQIQTNPKDILNITALYKPPQMPHNMFLNKLTDHLTSVGYLSGHNLLCGDFNLNMLLPKNESTSLKCLLEVFDLTITKNHYPTRTRGKRATCLDVLFSDFECNIHVQDYNVNDNSLVKLKMPTSLPMNTENGFRRRNWKKLEREDFKLFFNYNLNIALNDQNRIFTRRN